MIDSLDLLLERLEVKDEVKIRFTTAGSRKLEFVSLPFNIYKSTLKSLIIKIPQSRLFFLVIIVIIF